MVSVIEQELEKEAQYSRVKDYYRSNSFTSFISTYNTIFKEIDSVLRLYLASIPLSLQRAQIMQALLYQRILTSIDQVKEFDVNNHNMIKRLYNISQLRLHKLRADIPYNTIKEL